MVNRSDGRIFHLVLFSVTYARPNSSTNEYCQQLMCHFEYVHNRLGNNRKFVALTILDVNPGTLLARYQIEAAADSLAELIAGGNRVEEAYLFDKGQLISGFGE